MRTAGRFCTIGAENSCGTPLAKPMRGCGGSRQTICAQMPARQLPDSTGCTVLFKRAKSLVGLDIGSSAVKAVELKPAGRGGYKVVAFGSEAVPPDSIVDGAIIDGTAVADAIRRLFDTHKIKTREVAASLSGNAVIVKKIHASADDRGRARGVDPLGSGAVHPVRHPGRQSRLPDSRQRRRARREVDDGRAAGGGEEGKDRRLHGRHRAGGTHGGDRRRRRLRAPERVRGELRRRARAVGRAAQRRRERDRTSTSSAAISRSSPATSRSAATPTPRRCRRS